jgi:hypothetical protein
MLKMQAKAKKRSKNKRTKERSDHDDQRCESG